MNDYNNIYSLCISIFKPQFKINQQLVTERGSASLSVNVYFIYISLVQLKACWFCAYVLLCQIINVGRPLKSFGSVVLNIQWPNATKEGKRLLYLVQIKDHRKNIIHCTPAEAINPLRFIKVVPSLDVKLNNGHLLTSAVMVSTLQLSVFDIW